MRAGSHRRRNADSRRWHAEERSFALSRCADASDLVAPCDLDAAAQSHCVYTSRQAELHLYICEGLRMQLLGEVDSCQPDPLPRVAHQLPPHLQQHQCALWAQQVLRQQGRGAKVGVGQAWQRATPGKMQAASGIRAQQRARALHLYIVRSAAKPCAAVCRARCIAHQDQAKGPSAGRAYPAPLHQPGIAGICAED